MHDVHWVSEVRTLMSMVLCLCGGTAKPEADLRACTTLTFESFLKLFLRVSKKYIRDRLFIKRLTPYNFLYILYLECIYYETDLIDSILYYANS
jgi:hypothetical protein